MRSIHLAVAFSVVLIAASTSCQSHGIFSMNQCGKVCGGGFGARQMGSKIECKCSSGGCSDFGGALPQKHPHARTPQWIRANKNALLDWHNVYRCMHWGAGYKLTWNDDIAANAQNWADRMGGAMAHSSNAYRSDVGGYDSLGENLFWSSHTAEGKQVVKSWYDEIRLTHGGHVYSFGSGTGHYTQVIWKETKSLGCGINNNMVDCEYGPAGNMQGEFASNTDRTKYTQASCERYICRGRCATILDAREEAPSDADAAPMLGSPMPVLEADAALMLASPLPAVVAVAASAVGFIVGLVFLARRSSTVSPQPLLG